MNSLSLRVVGSKDQGDHKFFSKGKISVLPIPDIYLKIARTENFCFLKDVESLCTATNIEEQLTHLRNISKALMSVEEVEYLNYVIQLLCNLYLIAPLKHPIKNAIARLFSKSVLYKSAISKDLSVNIKQIIKEYNCNSNSEEYNNVINMLNACFDNFPIGVTAIENCIEDVLNYLYKTILFFINKISHETSPSAKSEIAGYIHNSLRLLLACLQQCKANHMINGTSIVHDQILKLQQVCKELLDNVDIAMETKGNCGIIIILSNNLINGSTAWKQLIPIILDADSLLISTSNGDKDMKQVCLFLGVVTVIDTLELCKSTEVINLCEKLVAIGERNTLEAASIVAVNRALLQLTRKILQVPDSFSTSYNGLHGVVKIICHFAWGLMEHSLDAVRHASRSIIDTCIKIAHVQEVAGYHLLLDELIQDVFSFSTNQCCRYIGLSILCLHIGCIRILNTCNDLVETMLEAVCDSNIARYVTQCYETLMKKHNSEVGQEMWLETWVNPLLEHFTKSSLNKKSNNGNQSFDSLIEKAVKLQPKLVDILVSKLCDKAETSSSELLSVFTYLRVARNLGVYDSVLHNTTKWKGVIEYDIIDNALVHSDDEVRLSALALLAETHKTTEFFTNEELLSVTWFLKYNVNCQSPATRQQFVALLHKILTRLKESYQVLCRNIGNLSNKQKKNILQIEEMKCMKNYYYNFVLELRKFCLDNLFTGANFSRRGTCLQLLILCQDVLLDFIGQDELDRLWTFKDAEILLKILYDTYESNKVLAVQLLTGCPPEKMQLEVDQKINKALDDILKLANSIRPIDCVTAAHYLRLLAKLPSTADALWPDRIKSDENTLLYLILWLLKHLKNSAIIARESLLIAAANNPLYGIVLCIRYLLLELDHKTITSYPVWRALFSSLISLLFEINDTVAPVVNNSSPEGYLPPDLSPPRYFAKDEASLNNDTIVTAQMVLLCGWRTVKEVSLLLGDISSMYEIYYVNNLPNDNSSIDSELEKDFVDIEKQFTNIHDNISKSLLCVNDNGFISDIYLLKIGEHFTKLLSETKHRGAFEQAYLGFSKLCARLWKTKDKFLCALPLHWLDDLLKEIQNDDSDNKFCATRRSAGVPFMVQALVTTELQHHNNPIGFPRLMAALMNILESTNSSVESRTHSLNILRALVRHSTLGDLIAPHVADLIMVAITGFGTNTWAERNASTLLFSALMTRIFGVQRTKDSEKLNIRNKMTGRIFFLRYPKLYDFILKQLMCSNISQGTMETELHPSLFPVLLLLSRLYPSALEGTESNLKLVSYIPYVLCCSGSRVLQARQLSARAMVALIMPDKIWDHIATLLNILGEPQVKRKTNLCHGLILQLIYALKYAPENSIWTQDIGDRIIEGLTLSSWMIPGFGCSSTENLCLVNAEAYSRVLMLILDRWDSPNEFFQNQTIHFWKNIEKCLTGCLQLLSNVGLSLYEKTAFQLHMLVKIMLIKYKENDIVNVNTLLLKGLQNKSYEVVNASLNLILCLYDVGIDINDLSDDFEITMVDKMIIKKLSTHKNELKELISSSDDLLKVLPNLIKKELYPETTKKTFRTLSLFPNLLRQIIADVSSLSEWNDDLILQCLVDMCNNYNDNISYCIINCINVFFDTLPSSSKICERTSNELTTLLLLSSSAEVTDVKRYTIAKIITKHYYLLSFTDTRNFLMSYDIGKIWTIVIVLLTDDEVVIRETVSQLVNRIGASGLPADSLQPVLPERAREVLLQLFDCPKPFKVAMLLGWALLADLNEEDVDDLEGRVFDKGEMNIYSEELTLTRECCQRLQFTLQNMDASEIQKYILDIVLKIFPTLYVLCQNNIVVLIERLISQVHCENFNRQWANINKKSNTDMISELSQEKVNVVSELLKLN